MGILCAHIAGFPVEEMLIPLSGLSLGVTVASVLRRISMMRVTIRRRDQDGP
jgi:hypothetical protein